MALLRDRLPSTGAVVVSSLTGLLVLYVFSPFLFLILFKKGLLSPGTTQMVGVIIAPLDWLYENVGWVRAFYDACMGWLGLG